MHVGGGARLSEWTDTSQLNWLEIEMGCGGNGLCWTNLSVASWTANCKWLLALISIKLSVWYVSMVT